MSASGDPADASWMRDFMACQGQIVLTNYLNGLNNRKGRVDVEMELELLKCMRTSLSSRVSRSLRAR